MKVCNDCNVEMIENCKLTGQHAFEVGPDGKSHISIAIPTGEGTNLLGINVAAMDKKRLKARVCPKCGKVELYVDFNDQSDILNLSN